MGPARGYNRGLLLTGSGSSWTAAEAPLPSNADSSGAAFVNGASCASASQCVAVGYYQDTSGVEQGLLLTWSGSSWTAAEAPLPANADEDNGFAGVYDLSCPSASQCVAVGEYQDTSGNDRGLLLTGAGSSWTATRAPAPSNADGSGNVYVVRVSCPSASQCVADGDYQDTSGDAQVYLLTGSA